jgi:beta-xylosidase
MKKIFWLAIAVFSTFVMASAAGHIYTNPVRTDKGEAIPIADPSVYECDGIYYLTGTTNIKDGFGFEYYTSRDLITWTFGGTLYRKPDNHIGTMAFWAPEVKRINGRFYLTYSCFEPNKKILVTCLAASDTPTGPFTDVSTPWFDLGYSVIDGDILVDDDGTPYFYFSKNETIDTIGTGTLYVVKLKKDLSGLDGKPVFVSAASQPWEKVNWKKNRCNEGPSVFKHKGIYYMTYSANDTGYEHYGIGVQWAKHPMGPWMKYKDNPLMTTDMRRGISSPGHNCIVTAPDGNLYIVYHRHADARCKKPNWDRVICIDRLYFDKHGRLRVVGPTSTPQHVAW